MDRGAGASQRMVNGATLIATAAISAATGAALAWVWLGLHPRRRHLAPPPADGVLGAIGGTPLIRIASLSAATNCEVSHLPYPTRWAVAG